MNIRLEDDKGNFITDLDLDYKHIEMIINVAKECMREEGNELEMTNENSQMFIEYGFNKLLSKIIKEYEKK
jgi:hypothetical protein